MRAVLCSDQVEGRDALRQVVINSGLECAADDCVSLQKVMPRLVLGNVDLVLVDFGPQPEHALKAIESASAKSKVPVLAIGPSSDPQLILQAQRSGARQFLDRSHPRDELISAIEKLHLGDREQFRRGRAMVVTAAVPGVGVTTVASGLAFALAAKHPKHVALLELDADVPELALDLDMNPTHPLSQVLRDWDRMDGATLRQATLEHPAGVYLLAEPPGAIDHVDLDPAAGKQLVSLFRALHDYTVIDLGHGAMSPGAQQVVKMAQTIVVVIRLDVPCLRLTKLFLKKLERIGVSQEAIFLVANRYGQRRQLPWKKVEETLGMPVKIWLPDDPATLNLALNHGTPLVQTSRRARITRRFDQMAANLNGAVK